MGSRKDNEVAEVFNQSVEAKIIRLEAERDARLTHEEARNRFLNAIETARQGAVWMRAEQGWGVNFGDLLGSDAASQEKSAVDGTVVQVVALADVNSALDYVFPAEDSDDRA